MAIELTGVTVDLPIYSSNARSLRKQLMPATVGGGLFARADHKVVVRALSNVSLRIEEGERVGLVGPNGAGKTTLLRVMSGAFAPTAGRVEVKGRISAALNVSLGLDMEVSGRENIYLLGYYRGLSRADIDKEVDEIVAAADLGSFIDLPTHTYSSGMMGRLTFSVATAFAPDVLLMDEWLMAGDREFNKRAAARSSGFVSKARIMVLASHSTGTIKDFCTHAAYMRGGYLVNYGPAEEILDQYEADARQHELVA